jgi:predicted TIM-barrel fold metal-dependent hydrolase
VLFGTDWPGPGVPDMGGNLEQVKALPISEDAKRAILSENALKLWPE